MVDAKNTEEVKIARDLSAKMALKAISLGGTCTGINFCTGHLRINSQSAGEHGIGTGKIELLKVEMVC